MDLQLNGSREAPNKGEESKHGDEEELEPVSREAEGELVNNNVLTDGSGVNLRLGRASQEGGHNSSTLPPLELSESIINDKLLAGLGKARLGGLSVKLGVALNLESRVGEVRDSPPRGGSLVAAARDVGERLPAGGLLSDGWVGSVSNVGRDLRDSRGGRGLADGAGAEGAEGVGGGQKAGEDGDALHFRLLVLKIAR